MFFKKLHVLLDSLPHQLKEINIDIGVRKVLLINLWDRFEENKYFHEDIELIKIECIKLAVSTYLVAITVKNIDQCIDILIRSKNNDHCKQI